MPTYVFGDRMRREYREMFDSAIVRGDGAVKLADAVWHIKRLKEDHEKIAKVIGCPWWFSALIHGMEMSFQNRWLANGDPLTGPTTHVPAGLVVPNREPPYDFFEAAIVSLKHQGLERETDWSLEHCLYLLEAYNGWGYRSHNDNSDYLWSFTNYEKAGRYVADGRWDPAAWSNQIGCVAMLKGLIAEGLVSPEGATALPGIDSQVGWFKAYRVDQNGQILTGVAAMVGAEPKVTWAGKAIDSLISFRKRFPNANDILIAPPTEAWPGDLPGTSPTVPTEPGVEPYLRVRRKAAGRRNADGLEDLSLELVCTAEPAWLVQSGVPGESQRFEIGGRDSGSGTGFPCPQGEYFVRDFAWADDIRDNWTGSHGAGLGPLFVPFDPKFETRRGKFGFHWDSNHPQNVRTTRESPFAGSAGCLVFRDLAELKRFAAVLRKYDPRRLSVQWGL